MNKFEKLMASRPEINYTFMPLPSKMGGLTDGNRIFIDDQRQAREQYQILLEELAHHDKGSGDITEQKETTDCQQEVQARSIAFEEAVPLNGLIDCFFSGVWSPDDIADHFDITIEFLFKAVENYRTKLGLVFQYKNYFFDLRRNVNITKID